MRRSLAPSMRKAKLSANDHNEISTSTVGASSGDSSWSWGSSKQSAATPSSWRKRENDAAEKADFFKGKLIFKIMWREITKKKHKTWYGDGVLEVNMEAKRAVLKDDKGKYLGSSTLFKTHEWAEGVEMVIGGKEIELQEQIKNQNEYWEMKKQHTDNRGWFDEEYQPPAGEDEPKEKKPKTAALTTVKYDNLVEDMLKKNRDIKIITSNKNELSEVKENIISVKLEPQSNKKEEKTSVKSNNKVKALVLRTPPSTECSSVVKGQLREVHVTPALAQHLRPHQREGVAFLYACLMGFQQSDYFGCILADEMGLGKTLQCLAVAHTMLRKGPFNGERTLQRVLVVTPSSLTANWEREIGKWLKTERMYGFVVDAKHKLSTYSQQQHVPFVIVSYDMLLLHAEYFQRLKFDLLICDEGHRLKNQATKIYTTLCDLSIKRRVILTGTPVQNNLQEFYALSDFVNPGIFSSYHEFRKYFELPLQQSQILTATEDVKKLAAERSLELNNISAKFMLRRLQQINSKYLPKKREYICFVKPSELQQFLLQKSLDLYRHRKDTILKDMSSLQIIAILKKICNHPSLISRTATSNVLTRYLERHLPDWSNMGPLDSSKLELVYHFLNNCVKQKREKCVLVSHYTKTLNMLQGLCDNMNIKCLRLDGSTPNAERDANVEKFNLSTNSGVDAPHVFLLSAKAGGFGLNLIGASRLILYDNDWNPAHDAQAMSRIWRDGQQNDVYIYRLITAGCIEEKIFQLQKGKLTLGDCVIGGNDNCGMDIGKVSAKLLDLFAQQTDFENCETHECLNCDCSGDGQNSIELLNSNDKQINQLMLWQHYQPQFDDELLEEACLSGACENLLYIFSNQTELS